MAAGPRWQCTRWLWPSRRERLSVETPGSVENTLDDHATQGALMKIGSRAPTRVHGSRRSAAPPGVAVRRMACRGLAFSLAASAGAVAWAVVNSAPASAAGG